MFTQIIYIMSFIDKSNKPNSLAFYNVSEALDYAEKYELTEIHLKSFKLIHNNSHDQSKTDEKASDKM